MFYNVMMPKTVKKIENTNTEQLSRNTKELFKVEKELKKQNSFSQSFLRGLITALGATLGLAIVLSALLFVIDAVAKKLGIENITNQILSNIKR